MAAEPKIEPFLDFLSAATCRNSSELEFSQVLVPPAAGTPSDGLVGLENKGAPQKRLSFLREAELGKGKKQACSLTRAREGSSLIV